MKYAIEFSPVARDHVRAFRKRDQKVILDAVERHLVNEPDHRSRNRKQLQQNELAPWELRVGDFRVFYDVLPNEEKVVVLAVGRKEHNRLFIDGKELQL